MRALLALLLLASCSPKEEKPKVTPFSGVAMTIPYRILIGDPIAEGREQGIQEMIDLTFHEVDKTFNKYNPDSELTKLNRLEAYTSEPVSVELGEILDLTADMVAISQGRFDPTVEPVQELWKEHLMVGCKPSEEAIRDIASSVGWNRIHHIEDQFWKEDSRTQLDLGGIAKGLCVDMLTERLVESGYPNVFVEWGGEIRVHGRHPDDRPWTVYISRLEDTDPDHAIETLTLDNQAIATSGDYLQRWTVGGTTYTHILDPERCRPLVVGKGSIASATVIAPTCSMADALATAAMLFPTAEEAREWAEEVKSSHPEVSFWIITRD